MKLNRSFKSRKTYFLPINSKKGEKYYQVRFISSNNLLEQSNAEAISSFN